MSTTYYVKFLRSGTVQPVMASGTEEEAVHHGCSHNLKCAKLFGDKAEDVLVFAVNLETRLVTYWATTFIKDPDNDPFYTVRVISPTDFETVKSWGYDEFQSHTIETIGNFEV